MYGKMHHNAWHRRPIFQRMICSNAISCHTFVSATSASLLLTTGHWNPGETQFCHQYVHTVLHPLQKNLHYNMPGHGKLTTPVQIDSAMNRFSLTNYSKCESFVFLRCWPTSGWCPTCVLEFWLACSISKLEMTPVKSSTTLASSFSPCCSWCLQPWCPPS